MKRFIPLIICIVMISLVATNATYAATSQTQNVRLKLANGAMYFGEVKNGTPNGQGLMKWSNNNWYDGSWKNGKRSGYGLFVSVKENNEEIYQGNWSNDQYNGTGSLVQRYKDSNYTYTLMPLNVYKGTFKNNKFVSGYSLSNSGMGSATNRSDFTYSDGKKKIVIASGDVSDIKYHIDSGLKKVSSDVSLTYFVNSDTNTYKGYSYQMINMGGIMGFDIFTGTLKGNEKINGNHHYVSEQEGNPIIIDQYKNKKKVSTQTLTKQNPADYYAKKMQSRIPDFLPYIKKFNTVYNLINFKIPDVNNLSQPKFVLDNNTGSQLKKRYIPGFDIKLGMTLTEVIKTFGSKTTEYWDAGDYQSFEGAPNTGFHFEIKGKSEILTALQIYGSQLPDVKTITQLKKVLGKPVDEGNDDVFGGYYVYYQIGDVDLYFNFKDKNGSLLSILIKGPYY